MGRCLADDQGPPHARRLADGITRSTLLSIDGAAHLAPVEQPHRLLNALTTT
ncbi:alpha/beta fold hydrolase [Streptomyces longwoodensis]|uniref:alpha/beta fold hydrolase n=1 Tax=Streptomyces longwoodensis TaxID=68231 RepID=UPI00379D7E77